eukprot:3743691-Prymnesium_polylepis.2
MTIHAYDTSYHETTRETRSLFVPMQPDRPHPAAVASNPRSYRVHIAHAEVTMRCDFTWW